jgi:hypothetical protein
MLTCTAVVDGRVLSGKPDHSSNPRSTHRAERFYMAFNILAARTGDHGLRRDLEAGASECVRRGAERAGFVHRDVVSAAHLGLASGVKQVSRPARVAGGVAADLRLPQRFRAVQCGLVCFLYGGRTVIRDRRSSVVPRGGAAA